MYSFYTKKKQRKTYPSKIEGQGSWECVLHTIFNEVKRSYTDLINIYVKDDKQKLKVFDRNGVYLPTKKIGKNNPKAEQIKTDNQYRTMWNQTVDRALISGVPEGQILEVKQSEIGQKVKASIQKSGRNPALLKSLIMTAIYALELLIGKVFKMASQKADKVIEPVEKKEPEQAEQLKTQIVNMKHYLSSIVQGYGYKNVKEFLAEYKASKAEYTDYQSAVVKWEQQTGNKAEPDSLKAKLQKKTQEVKKRENNRQSQHYRSDRGGR